MSASQRPDAAFRSNDAACATPTPDGARGWYLYIVRCADDSLYTGISTDVERRLAEHRRGGSRGARYVRSRTVRDLIYSKAVGDRSAASIAESAVKALDKARKEALAAGALTLDEVLASRALARTTSRKRAPTTRRSQRDRTGDPVSG